MNVNSLAIDEGGATRKLITWLLILGLMAILIPASTMALSKTYTLDADFDEGTLLNVNHDTPNNDQIQLNATTTPFPFINIAASARGTVVRINTQTGQIIGEYKTAPDGRGLNPSRTTVDLFGNVWVGNRNESAGGQGSVTKIGLIIGGTRVNADGTPNPAGQYLKPPFDYSTVADQDSDGLIKTSYGLGNILPWTNAGAVDDNGGVLTAEDESIIHYVRTSGTNVRTVAVDANNDVWVGGLGNRVHEKIDTNTGTIVAGTTFSAGPISGRIRRTGRRQWHSLVGVPVQRSSAGGYQSRHPNVDSRQSGDDIVRPWDRHERQHLAEQFRCEHRSEDKPGRSHPGDLPYGRSRRR